MATIDCDLFAAPLGKTRVEGNYDLLGPLATFFLPASRSAVLWVAYSRLLEVFSKE